MSDASSSYMAASITGLPCFSADHGHKRQPVASFDSGLEASLQGDGIADHKQPRREIACSGRVATGIAQHIFRCGILIQQPRKHGSQCSRGLTRNRNLRTACGAFEGTGEFDQDLVRMLIQSPAFCMITLPVDFSWISRMQQSPRASASS